MIKSSDQDRSRRVRLRLGRSLWPLLVAALVLCAAVVWHRDATHVEKACARVESYLEPLRRYMTAHGTLPLHYPIYRDLSATAKTSKFTYFDEDTIRWARRADGPALIGYGTAKGLIVRSNGRATVFHDSGKVYVEWLAHHEIHPRVEEQKRLAEAAADRDAGS